MGKRKIRNHLEYLRSLAESFGPWGAYVDNDTRMYLLECEGFYKIGISNNIHKRMSNIQSGNPFKVSLISTTRAVNPARYEHYLHGLFENTKIRGEWFKLSCSQISILLADFHKHGK